MTVGSLFAGIGGFDLGFERAGFEIKWQVEIDPFCRAVLEKHWPHVRRYDDVRHCMSKWRADQWTSDQIASGCGDAPCPPISYHGLEEVDVIVGGFPCQDISFAGPGGGLAGKRSGLWVEYERLIRELRPRYVVVENVAALLARGLGDVLGDLAACGYNAEWDCVPAEAIGANHQRDRIWVVAYANGERQLQPEGRQRHERRWLGYSGQKVADADGSGLPQSRNAGATGSGPARIFTGATLNRGSWWATEPDVGRVAHGVPARVDRLRGLGNAIVPQIAEWIARRILDAEVVR